MMKNGLLRFAAVTLAAWLCTAAQAGNFGVTPIRLDLDRNNKSGAITVTNTDDKLQLQMRAFEWTQDADGKDVYTETSDLIFFPKLMSMTKDEQRVIRTSYKVPATQQEKTYRLFIEEIPEPKKDNSAGAQVSVAVRFGVPVFLHPIKNEMRGEIDSLQLNGNQLAVGVKNTGNEHFIINAIELKGDGGFESRNKGWYLLAGAQRSHRIDVPADLCEKMQSLAVTIKTDKGEFARTLDLKAACGR